MSYHAQSEDLLKAAADAATGLGEVVAVVKLAREIPDPDLRATLVNRLTPVHVGLLECFREVGGQV